MADELDIDQIGMLIGGVHNQYPWASEDAVQRLAELSRSHNIKSSALAVAIAQTTNSSDVKSLEREIYAAISTADSATDKVEKAAKKVQGEMDSFGKSLGGSGLEGFADIVNAGAQSLAGLAGGIRDAIPAGGRFGAIAGRVVGFGTEAMVATTGLGVIFSKLMTEQEKAARQMINLGVIVNDQDLYTEFRDRAANMAMSFTDYIKIAETTKQAMTGVTRDAVQGQLDFTNFIGRISAEDASRFGYAPQELAQQLANEVNLLYKVNQMNGLNEFTDRKIIDSFNTVNSLSLYLADNIGVQRSEQLALRQQARENVDFRRALLSNEQYLLDTFGEAAVNNVREADDFFFMLMSTSLGKEFGEMAQQDFNNTLQDIRFDHSALNNINPQMMAVLQRLGPDIVNMYAKMIEDMSTGKLDAESTILRQQEFVRAVRNTNVRIQIDEVGAKATGLIAQASQALTIDPSVTLDDLRLEMERSTQASDTAGTSIAQVGEIAIAFREAANAITPGFDSMSELFNIINTSAETFGEVWTSVWGLEDYNTYLARRRQEREQRRRERAARDFDRARGNPPSIPGGLGGSGGGTGGGGSAGGGGGGTTPQPTTTTPSGRGVDTNGNPNFTGDPAFASEGQTTRSVQRDTFTEADAARVESLRAFDEDLSGEGDETHGRFELTDAERAYAISKGYITPTENDVPLTRAEVVTIPNRVRPRPGNDQQSAQAAWDTEFGELYNPDGSLKPVTGDIFVPPAPPAPVTPPPSSGSFTAPIDPSLIERRGQDPINNSPHLGGLPTEIGSLTELQRMIIDHEGVIDHPYRDTLGLWTIGIGHLLNMGRSPAPYSVGQRISTEEIMRLFEQDFQRLSAVGRRTPGYELANTNGKAAMIDLAFNMGEWWPTWPVTRAAMERGDWAAAAAGLRDSRWFTQVGRRGPQIVQMMANAGNGAPQDFDQTTSTRMPPPETVQPPQPQAAVLQDRQTRLNTELDTLRAQTSGAPANGAGESDLAEKRRRITELEIQMANITAQLEAALRSENARS